MDTMTTLPSAGETLDTDGKKTTDSAVYDIAGSTLSTPGNAAILMRFRVARPFSLPAGLTDSDCRAFVPATAITVLSIKKNGSTVGTMTFAAGGTPDVVAVLAMASETIFAKGDKLTIENQATADGSLDDISWTLVANLV